MGKRKSYQDFDMLQRLRQGGSQREKAMRDFYLHERDAAISYLQKLGCDTEMAYDLFQDAVVQLLLAIEDGKFQAQSSLKTYLYAICKNIWYAKLRRQGVEQKYQDFTLNQSKDLHVTTPEAVMVDQSQQEQIHKLLSHLGEACQKVLTLWSLRYDMKEIADKLGYANDQIARNKKSRCLSRLKSNVADNPAIRSLVQELNDSKSAFNE